MCWRGQNNLKIAARKIPIFKIGLCINNTLVSSIVKKFMYELNYEYDIENELVVEKFDDDGSIIINEGFHSYSSRCTLTTNPESVLIMVRHNNKLLDFYFKYDTLCKIKGYIPKGTPYYINEDNEIVSKAICLTAIEPLT